MQTVPCANHARTIFLDRVAKISWLLGLAENDGHMLFAQYFTENSDLLLIFWAREM